MSTPIADPGHGVPAFRIWVAILLLLVVLLPALDLGAAERAAPSEEAAQPGLLPEAPSPTVAPAYRDAVFGDFRLVGNSVLRCPVDGEVSGDHSPADCAAATGGTDGSGGALLDNSGNNNGYYMHLADDDGRQGSFSSSRAEVAIPPGATVRHAQLNWGGHTGTFIGFSGVNCTRPLLLQGEPPPPPAAPTPAQQQVRIAVAGGEPVPVERDPGHFRTTDGLTEPSQIYTDWADVTGAFTGVPTDGPVEVSVSDVWAPSGPGCAGGWSLVVVFGYDTPREPYLQPRVVDLYTDDLPKSGALLPGLLEPLVPGFPTIIDGLLPGLVPALTGTSVILPGVARDRSGADVEIGVTAYDGDWRQGGETFSVDGEPVVEPCRGDGTADFFRSCADGAVDPLDPAERPVNNLSVDAKTVTPALADNDTGEIEIGVDSVGDFVVLQNVVLAETIAPAVSVTNTGPAAPVVQGELATFDIDIRNDGAVPLFDIDLVDTSEPASDRIRCAPAVLPALAPGEVTRVTCVQPAGDVPFTNTATVTAAYLLGPGGMPRTVTASASADVQVEKPPYAIERVPDRLIAHAGDPVMFAVTLTNNTTGDLTDVSYTDSAVPGCALPAETVLTPAAPLRLDCVATAPAEDFTSSGELRGVDATGAAVVVASLPLTVAVIDPRVTVSQVADKDTVYRGDSVELTFTVTNAGDEPDEALAGLRVTTVAGCVPDPVARLARGESATVACTFSPTGTVEVPATVSGLDVTGEPVTAAAEPVTITVLEPLLRLAQRADASTVRVGSEVTITFTATHTGDAEDGALTDVRVTSPTLPPDCLPEPIARLAPGESQSRSCSAIPDRSFDNQAVARAVDELNRPMEVAAPPLRITVVNPALAISTTADPEEAKHGAEIDFVVTVRNIGDVPLTLEVGNDNAPDCDIEFTDRSLRASEANGKGCTVTAPDEGTEFTNTASFTASPTAGTGDTGEPITGSDAATVTLLAGQAPTPPAPGTDPVTGDGGGSSGDGNGGGGGSSSDGKDDEDDDLASTGASVAVPVGLGVSLLVLGALAMAVTSRRRDDENSFLSRWWPGN